MPHFIKAGYWEKLRTAPKEWLNLDFLIQTLAPTASVQNSITQGVTTLAPSEDAVYNALLLKANNINPAVALTNAASIDIASVNNTLSSSSATRIFTISYTGDVTETEVTLGTTSAVYTFPATALCINSDGSASGDNTVTLSGVSGDKYLIMTNKIGSNYYIVAKNFGQ